jgi:2-oxoglutarate ferredoxin oxidoreductase subunit alpha
VLSDEQLARLKSFERYRDVDGDGIPYRTVPGLVRDPRGAYFTRGSGHDEFARYSEDPEVFRRNMDRLKKKTQSARGALPRPVVETMPGARVGVIAYGSTNNAMREARDQLLQAGIKTDYLRLRATPLPIAELEAFLKSHDRIYVVEQNRDAQMSVLIRATITAPGLVEKLRSVLYYTGFPIDARSISDGVVHQERGA